MGERGAKQGGVWVAAGGKVRVAGVNIPQRQGEARQG